MATPITTICPSCRTAMEMHTLPSLSGGTVDLDLCFQCHGMWMDPQENLKLAPAAVAELFKIMHTRRDTQRQPLASQIHCPRCQSGLTQGFDVVRTGRYITHRCANGHGRFSVFSSFMIEKGFVRLLTAPEIADIAQRVAVIHCNGCGAPVDLRKDTACPHCRSAFSLLDPTAVEKALQNYAKTAKASRVDAPHDLADALITLERDRQRTLRDRPTQSGALLPVGADIDLWSIGIALVGALLD